MPKMILQPSITSTIVNGTVTRNSGIRIPDFVEMISILLTLAAGSVVTGNLNLFLQDSVDEGVTWDDLVAFSTFAFGAAAVTQRALIQCSGIPSTILAAAVTNITQCSPAQQEAMAAGTVRQGPIGSLFRVREKVSAIAGGPTGVTYSIFADLR